MTKAELKKLEHENDKALLAFWTATELVRKCEEDLYASREKQALMLANYERDKAQAEMCTARSAYLKAKIKAEERKG